jgi:hypothetical protein
MARFVKLFTAKDTFRARSACVPKPLIVLRVISNGVTVDLLFSFACGDDVWIFRNDKRITTIPPGMNFLNVSMNASSRKRFLSLFEALFPKDKALSSKAVPS